MFCKFKPCIYGNILNIFKHLKRYSFEFKRITLQMIEYSYISDVVNNLWLNQVSSRSDVQLM